MQVSVFSIVGCSVCSFLLVCQSESSKERFIIYYYYLLPRMVYHVCLKGYEGAFGGAQSSIYVTSSIAVAEDIFLFTSCGR